LVTARFTTTVEVSGDGYILGTFTDRVQSPLDAKGVCPVYFFKIKAGGRQPQDKRKP